MNHIKAKLMHWRDMSILTWIVGSAVVFNGQILGHALWQTSLWLNKPTTCNQCQHKIDDKGKRISP